MEKQNEVKQREEQEEANFEREEIAIMPYETFKLHDLANMFPFNITPALIESKIQHELAAKHRMQEMTKNFIIFALIIIFGGSIAAYIVWKFFGKGMGAQEVKVTIDYAGNLIG